MIYTIRCRRGHCGARFSHEGSNSDPVHNEQILGQRAISQGWFIDMTAGGWLCPFDAPKPEAIKPLAPTVCSFPGCLNASLVTAKDLLEKGGWHPDAATVNKWYCLSCWMTMQAKPASPLDPGKWLDDWTAKIQAIVREALARRYATAPLQCAGEGCLNECTAATYEEAEAMGWAQVPMMGDLYLCKGCHDDWIKKMVGTPQIAGELKTYEYWANEVKAIAAQVMHDKLKEMLPRAANLAGISGVEQPALTYLQMAMVESFYPDPEGTTDARPVRGPGSQDAARDKNPGSGDGPGGDRSSPTEPDNIRGRDRETKEDFPF